MTAFAPSPRTTRRPRRTSSAASPVRALAGLRASSAPRVSRHRTG